MWTSHSTRRTSWEASESWLPLMTGCGDWCMVMPAITTWTTTTCQIDWESSPPWRSSCSGRGYCWCVPWMLKPQKDWTIWWRNLPWRSASTWSWWRKCSRSLRRSRSEPEAEFQILRALDPIAQVQLEVEEEWMWDTRKRHGLRQRWDQFYQNPAMIHSSPQSPWSINEPHTQTIHEFPPIPLNT